jgi:hypothetical protein
MQENEAKEAISVPPTRKAQVGLASAHRVSKSSPGAEKLIFVILKKAKELHFFWIFNE